ncbi:conserved Plasmodium protein, unknown function [Plasmodium relictum]|uniref:Uncharacterized protein n=1 Tax=Plasmodium relictum TaxID=85471 RepID=A0A1J1HDR2_PLARL|nr:conserved Plasmodium protein, unknown function [Plasmodium relictum]
MKLDYLKARNKKDNGNFLYENNYDKEKTEIVDICKDNNLQKEEKIDKNEGRLKMQQSFEMENKTLNDEVKENEINNINENSMIEKKSNEFKSNNNYIISLNEEDLKSDNICESKETSISAEEKIKSEKYQEDISHNNCLNNKNNYNLVKEINCAENTKNEIFEKVKNSKNEENAKGDSQFNTNKKTNTCVYEKKELCDNTCKKNNNVKSNSFSSDKKIQNNDIKCVNDIKIDNCPLIEDSTIITKNYIKNIDIFKYNEKEKMIELHKNDKNTNINIYKRMYQSYILLKREHQELIEENRKKIERNKKLKYELQNLKNNNYYSNFFFRHDSDNLFDDLASGFSSILKWINIENKIVQKNPINNNQKNNNNFLQNDKNAGKNCQIISQNKINIKKKKKVIYQKQESKLLNNDLSSKKKDFIKIEHHHNKEIQQLNQKILINANKGDKLNKNEICENDTFKTTNDTMIHDACIVENNEDIKNITKKGLKENSTNNKNIDENLIKNDNFISEENISNEKKVDTNLIYKESFISNDKVDCDKSINKNVEKKENFINNENDISDDKSLDKSLISDKKLEENNLSFHVNDNISINNKCFDKNKNIGRNKNIEKDYNTKEKINVSNIPKKKEGTSNLVNSSKVQKIKKNSFLWEKENAFKKKEIKYYYNKECEKAKCFYKQNNSLLLNDSINENIIDYIKKKLNNRIRNMKKISKNGNLEKSVFHICNYKEDKYIPLNLSHFFIINENMHSDIDLSLNHLKNIDFILKKKKKKNLINKSNNIKKNIIMYTSNDGNKDKHLNLTNDLRKNVTNNINVQMNKNNNSHYNEINIRDIYDDYPKKKKDYNFKHSHINCNYENGENSKEKKFYFLNNIKEKYFCIVNKSGKNMINKNFKNIKNKSMKKIYTIIQKNNINFIFNRIGGIEKKNNKNNKTSIYKFKLINNRKNEISLHILKKNSKYRMIFTNVFPNNSLFYHKKYFMLRTKKFPFYKGIINNNDREREFLKEKKKKIEIENILKYNVNKNENNIFFSNSITNKEYILKKENKIFNENNSIIKKDCAYKNNSEEEYEVDIYDKNESIERIMEYTKSDEVSIITRKEVESTSNNEDIIKIEKMKQEKDKSNKINEKMKDDIFENNVDISVNSELLKQFKELLTEHIESLNILSKKIDKIENENNCEVIIMGIKLVLNDKYIFLLVDALNSIENIVCKWINKNKEIIKSYIRSNSKIYKFFKYYDINIYIFFCNLLNILENYIEQFPFYFSISFEDLFYVF